MSVEESKLLTHTHV